MTSAINPNNIDGSYPVAGQDNNSQGFRDNFTNIKVNFQDAADEITDLQNKAVLKAALTGTTLDNNMGDALIYAAKIQDFSGTKVTVSSTSGSITLNYASGHYQAITTSGSVTLAFTNWPGTGSYGYFKIQINITNTAHTLTLPASVTLGTSGLQGYSAGTITFSSTGTYEFGFGTYDGGSTVTIFDLNRALTNFSGADLNLDDVTATGNIVASTSGKFISAAGNVLAGLNVSAAGNVTGGNINTAGVVSATGNIRGGNINTAGLVSATGNVVGGNVVGFVRPTAGSASQSPILLTSGTNLTSPAGGAIEYDGVVLYGTPTASSRGVLPATQFIALASNYVANDSSTAQKVFNSPTNGAVTLDANTTYFLEATYYITRTAGTNAHTIGVLFALGGTLTSIAYTATVTDATSNSLATASSIYATAATELVVTSSSSNANQYNTIRLVGIVRTNTAGTFTPQIKYSSAPGGAPTILANSFLKLIPVGSGTVASVGNWS